MNLDKPAPALSRLSELDLELCRRLARLQSSMPVLRLSRLVSRLGDGPFWFGLAAVLVVLGGRGALPAVLRLSVVGILAAVVSRSIKGWANRPRPFCTEAGIAAGAEALDPWSFPSGHTLHAVAFNGVLVADHPALAVALLPWTLAIAISRVVLGLHYPSDVAAGAAIGALLASAVLALS